VTSAIDAGQSAFPCVGLGLATGRSSTPEGLPNIYKTLFMKTENRRPAMPRKNKNKEKINLQY